MKRKKYNCSECGIKVEGVVYGDSSIVYDGKEQNNILGEFDPNKKIKVCVKHSENIEEDKELQEKIGEIKKEEELSDLQKLEGLHSIKFSQLDKTIESMKDFSNSISALVTENRNRIVELEKGKDSLDTLNEVLGKRFNKLEEEFKELSKDDE